MISVTFPVQPSPSHFPVSLPSFSQMCDSVLVSRHCLHCASSPVPLSIQSMTPRNIHSSNDGVSFAFETTERAPTRIAPIPKQPQLVDALGSALKITGQSWLTRPHRNIRANESQAAPSLFPCPISRCQMRFSLFNDLQRHIQYGFILFWNVTICREHDQSDSHLQCIICRRQFSRKDSLTRHLKKNVCHKPILISGNGTPNLITLASQIPTQFTFPTTNNPVLY